MFGAFSIFGMIVVIFLMILMFKLTLFTFCVVGKVIGWVWGILGWLIVGIFAVTVCGFAVFFLPIILIVGLFSILMAIVSLTMKVRLVKNRSKVFR